MVDTGRAPMAIVSHMSSAQGTPAPRTTIFGLNLRQSHKHSNPTRTKHPQHVPLHRQLLLSPLLLHPKAHATPALPAVRSARTHAVLHSRQALLRRDEQRVAILVYRGRVQGGEFVRGRAGSRARPLVHEVHRAAEERREHRAGRVRVSVRGAREGLANIPVDGLSPECDIVDPASTSSSLQQRRQTGDARSTGRILTFSSRAAFARQGAGARRRARRGTRVGRRRGGSRRRDGQRLRGPVGG